MLSLISPLNWRIRNHSRLFYSSSLPIESEILSRKRKDTDFFLVYESASLFDSNAFKPPKVFDSEFHSCTSGLVSQILGKQRFHFPRLGVVSISDSYVYGRNGWIFTNDGFLLADTTWYRHHEAELPSTPAPILPLKRLRGTTASLCSDHCIGNYGHFILDCLSRIHLLESAGYKLSDFDHILMPRPPSKNALALAEKAGIPLSKAVWCNDNFLYQTDDLFATTFPGLRRSYPSWLPDYLKKLIPQTSRSETVKVYIPRDSRIRNIVNDAELQQIALSFGYKIFSPANQVDANLELSCASHVISASGAALTDIIFCNPDAKVLELMPSDHSCPYYYSISLAGGLDYYILFGKSLGCRAKGSWGPSVYDFVIDTSDFTNAILALE